MTDKRVWTADEENENDTLVRHYINQAYQNGVVDEHLYDEDVFNNRKDGEKEERSSNRSSSIKDVT